MFYYLGNPTDDENDERCDDHSGIIEVPTESGLMFVYQTAWMKRLLKLYDEMILPDATSNASIFVDKDS